MNKGTKKALDCLKNAEDPIAGSSACGVKIRDLRNSFGDRSFTERVLFRMRSKKKGLMSVF